MASEIKQDELANQEMQCEEICKRVAELEATIARRNEAIARLKQMLQNCHKFAFKPDTGQAEERREPCLK